MRLLRRRDLWRRLRRRVFAGIALVAYLVAAVGFPVPAIASRAGGVPFPCQNHPCGCQSAEQCWRSCCCFSVEEHWAWARANHVEPPTYATRPADKPVAPKSWSTPRQRARAASTHACAECARRASCCEARPAAPEKPPVGTTWIGGPSAFGCRGASTLWIATGAVTPPPAHPMGHPADPPAGWLLPSSEIAVGSALIPPDPPPRVAHS